MWRSKRQRPGLLIKIQEAPLFSYIALLHMCGSDGMVGVTRGLRTHFCKFESFSNTLSPTIQLTSWGFLSYRTQKENGILLSSWFSALFCFETSSMYPSLAWTLLHTKDDLELLILLTLLLSQVLGLQVHTTRPHLALFDTYSLQHS